MEDIIQEVINYLLDNKLLIKLEALIGGGKSTLCNSFNKWVKSYITLECYPEPIKKMLLNLFYSDIKKYAFSFQSIVIRERVHVFEDAVTFLHEGNLAVIDRSPYGDCAFGLMHYASGNISPVEFLVYVDLIKSDRDSKVREFNSEKFDIKIKKIVVYLACDPVIARERVINRDNEDEVDKCKLEYLIDLHTSYMKVFGFEIVNQEEELAISEVRSDKEQIIFIDYNRDFPIDSDGCMTKEDTFKILYEIIREIK
jgi:deoxyadenosine/deoxycytidine kinase